MKKSEILEQVKQRLKSDGGGYICLFIEDISYYAYAAGEDVIETHHNCEMLTDYITKYIGDSEYAIDHGVAGWLFSNGYIDGNTMYGDRYNTTIVEYRLAWLDNMIEYFESKGQ